MACSKRYGEWKPPAENKRSRSVSPRSLRRPPTAERLLEGDGEDMYTAMLLQLMAPPRVATKGLASRRTQ